MQKPVSFNDGGKKPWALKGGKISGEFRSRLPIGQMQEIIMIPCQTII